MHHADHLRLPRRLSIVLFPFRASLYNNPRKIRRVSPPRLVPARSGAIPAGAPMWPMPVRATPCRTYRPHQMLRTFFSGQRQTRCSPALPRNSLTGKDTSMPPLPQEQTLPLPVTALLCALLTARAKNRGPGAGFFWRQMIAQYARELQKRAEARFFYARGQTLSRYVTRSSASFFLMRGPTWPATRSHHRFL